jgi:eukaryotic-like serine/threonine-protein kinase
MAKLNEEQILGLRRLAEAFLTDENHAALGMTLGAGASAAVFDLARGESRRALKVYLPELLTGSAGLAEKRRLRLQEKLINHTCNELVQIHSVVHTPETCFVEMENVPGADLNETLLDIPRDQIWGLTQQLVRAVKFLESVGLAHRDIKPHNIRVSADFRVLKLLDLGVVRELEYESGPDGTEQGQRRPFIATAQYSSPEYLFWLHPPSSEMWRALSIYQVGAVMHDLIRKQPIFADEVAMENRYALAMAVLQKVPSTHAEDLPTYLCALASRCLAKDMKRRVAQVTWEDFEDSSTGSDSIGRRFQQLRRGGTAPIERALTAHQREHARRMLFQSLHDRLSTLIRKTLNGCQLQQHQRGTLRVLSILVPQKALLIDFAMAVDWSEVSSIESGSVRVFGALRPEGAEFSDAIPTRDIVVVTEESMDSAADVLHEKAIQFVGAAMDLIDAGNEMTSVQALDAGSI